MFAGAEVQTGAMSHTLRLKQEGKGVVKIRFLRILLLENSPAMYKTITWIKVDQAFKGENRARDGQEGVPARCMLTFDRRIPLVTRSLPCHLVELRN